MTREEAKEVFLNRGFVNGYFDGDKWRESIIVISKWLQQEPCEDAISRKAVLDAIMANCIWENEYNLTSSRIKKTVESLPSVTPKQKTGRWIEHFDESGKWYECDQCHTDWGGSVNYCPNCGAIMKGEADGK